MRQIGKKIQPQQLINADNLINLVVNVTYAAVFVFLLLLLSLSLSLHSTKLSVKKSVSHISRNFSKIHQRRKHTKWIRTPFFIFLVDYHPLGSCSQCAVAWQPIWNVTVHTTINVLNRIRLCDDMSAQLLLSSSNGKCKIKKIIMTYTMATMFRCQHIQIHSPNISNRKKTNTNSIEIRRMMFFPVDAVEILLNVN